MTLIFLLHELTVNSLALYFFLGSTEGNLAIRPLKRAFPKFLPI